MITSRHRSHDGAGVYTSLVGAPAAKMHMSGVLKVGEGVCCWCWQKVNVNMSRRGSANERLGLEAQNFSVPSAFCT